MNGGTDIADETYCTGVYAKDLTLDALDEQWMSLGEQRMSQDEQLMEDLRIFSYIVKNILDG